MIWKFPSSHLHLCSAGLTGVPHTPFVVLRLGPLLCACLVHPLPPEYISGSGDSKLHLHFISWTVLFGRGMICQLSADCFTSWELISIILSFWDLLCHANQGSQTGWAGSSQGPNRWSLLIVNGRIIAGLWLSTVQQTSSRFPSDIDSGWCSAFHSHLDSCFESFLSKSQVKTHLKY